MKYVTLLAKIIEPGDPVVIAEISGKEVLLPLGKVLITRREAVPARKVHAGEIVSISMPEDMAREKELLEA